MIAQNVSILVLRSVIGSALTLYMLAILVRWTAPWIELDLQTRYLRWIPRITDPAIQLVRRVLPAAGPVDWSPIATVIAVWVVRLILLQY